MGCDSHYLINASSCVLHDAMRSLYMERTDVALSEKGEQIKALLKLMPVVMEAI